jgi:Cytidylate kinase
MNLQPSLGHAETYINIHLSRSGPEHHGKGTGPFVTVSRESGVGGATFARLLASRLDEEMPGDVAWTVFDRNLVEEMLRSEHLSPRLARFLPEDRISEIDASIGELLGLHPSLWTLIQRTNDMMRELARRGQAILVGRGANFATESIAGGLHVRLVAPAIQRAGHMARQMGLTMEEAARRNVRIDAARAKFVRSVFASDVDRASGYDVTLNLGSVPLDAAVDMAMTALRSRVAMDLALQG